MCKQAFSSLLCSRFLFSQLFKYLIRLSAILFFYLPVSAVLRSRQKLTPGLTSALDRSQATRSLAANCRVTHSPRARSPQSHSATQRQSLSSSLIPGRHSSQIHFQGSASSSFFPKDAYNCRKCDSKSSCPFCKKRKKKLL